MDKQKLIEALQNINGKFEVFLVAHNGILCRLHNVDIAQGVVCLHPTITSVYNRNPIPERVEPSTANTNA
jgi:hypothetical protein